MNSNCEGIIDFARNERIKVYKNDLSHLFGFGASQVDAELRLAFFEIRLERM